MTEVRRYEVLLLKTDIFCTKRCLATVSNNSATTSFSLLVIRNGRQEVHARTLTSVYKSGIAVFMREFGATHSLQQKALAHDASFQRLQILAIDTI